MAQQDHAGAAGIHPKPIPAVSPRIPGGPKDAKGNKLGLDIGAANNAANAGMGMKNNKPAGWVSPSSHQAAQTPIMERLAKERQERQEAYEREKREKEEKHRKAIEDIRQRGK